MWNAAWFRYEEIIPRNDGHAITRFSGNAVPDFHRGFDRHERSLLLIAPGHHPWDGKLKRRRGRDEENFGTMGAKGIRFSFHLRRFWGNTV